MAGEGTRLKSRRLSSRTSAVPEEDGAMRKTEGDQSFRAISNGRVDVEHVISRKMQLKRKAEELKLHLMKEVDGHLSEFVENLIEESTLLESASTFPAACTEKDGRKGRGLKSSSEHGKIFISRRSLLDELFEVNHIRTIYHMFIALLILFIFSTLLVDFIDEGRLVLEFDLLVFAFGKFPIVIATWLCMFLSTLMIPYSLFHLWASGYQASSHQTLRSLVFGTFFMLFQIVGLGFGPTYIVVKHSLPPASRFVVILEQIRFFMKVHSFVRENVPRVLASAKEKSTFVPTPKVTSYLYFLFAPTLIYRDSYPRNPSIRWHYVLTKFAQVLGCLFYAYYMFVRLCIPLFHNISQEPFNLRVLVLCIFNSILPGVLALLLAFFAFLHCWLNAFAEMLRFADRMFYKDWWNSTSFANYYRTWNVVVHDWLYYYTYKDFILIFGKRFKAAAMLYVFTVSAVVHEYALAICFGFFYPVMFILFMGFGMLFNFILHDRRKGPIWNVTMWTSLFLGQGVLLCLYSQEWYARQYCPLHNVSHPDTARAPTFMDYLKPRSWTCYLQL
uniref:O-acyltransferase n=1 Tax=Geotrypetes seraphini TaxID=260995 RepID=A0A6P8N9G1_GEOSA|nr:sterol O-acyltransferase 1 isoform X1 [Geotrypetes seraphini]XP_033772267.1 sterol O-acyltransferase 1 isoform X1 [Geotrypetes seraphini]